VIFNKILWSVCQSLPDSFGNTFTEIGTFNYNCQVHRAMIGTIIVNVNPVPEFGPLFGLVFVGTIIGVLIISKRYYKKHLI